MRAAMLLVLTAGLAWAAAPPAKLTREQRDALRRARDLDRQVIALLQEGKAEKAVPLAEKARGIWKETLGERHPDYANSLNNLAGLHEAMGDHKAALPLNQKALAILKDALGERHPDYATSLNYLAGLHKAMGDHKAALPLLEKARAILKDARGEMHPDYALSLNNLAALHEAMGDHKAALPLLEKALAICKATLGERHPDYALSLNNLTSLHKAMGDHKAALPLLEKALAIQKAARGERHPAYATILNNLALLHEAMGDYKAALPLVEKAQVIWKAALGERHPDFVGSLNNLAMLHKAMGDHKAALPLLEKARGIWKETLGERHPAYATILNNLALLHKDMGDHKAALPLLEKALAIRKETLGERHPDYANSLNNLAGLHEAMGDHKAALSLYQKALAILKDALGERHPDYALSLNNLAALHEAMGDHKAALPLLEKALAIRKETLGERHSAYATTLNNLAALHRGMGDHKAALPLNRKALAIRKAALGERHPDCANSLNNLAALHEAMGDHKAALPLLEKALAIQSSRLRDDASVQSDRQQLAAAHAVRYVLDNRLSVPDLEGHPTAASHVLAWKGSVLLRQQQRRLFLRLAPDSETRAAAERLQAVTRRLVALRQSPSAAKAKLDEAEKEQDAAQAGLARLSEAFRDERGRERPSAEMLARALPEGVALIDYLFYHDRLAAFVHRRGKPAVRIDLKSRALIEQAVLEWRRQLTGGKDGLAAGTVLKELVYSPLEKHLEGARVVLVSSDGVLGLVPFAALPGKKEGTYLIEDVALAVVPVPSVIPEMVKPMKDRLKPSLLVAGDLHYDPEERAAAPLAGEDHRSAARTGREKFSPLPATRAELLAVEGSYKELFRGGAATTMKKSEATKAAVRKALASVRYAHLATHGFFTPEQVKSALSDEGRPRLGEQKEPVGWHPLLLSGLALSGANREPKPGEEDGILTALEVSEMDLTKLELAVLSACETGIGKVAGGEGLLGLQRAFQAAGARSVIASLWKVDDHATQRLMTDFYATAWDTKNTVSKAEALRKAQLAMLFRKTLDGKQRGVGLKAEKLPEGGERLPPYYWAPFVLSGDWR